MTTPVSSPADTAPAERVEPGIPLKALTGEPMTLADWLEASLGWIESGNIDLAKSKIEEVAAELVARDALAPGAGGAGVERVRPEIAADAALTDHIATAEARRPAQRLR